MICFSFVFVVLLRASPRHCFSRCWFPFGSPFGSHFGAQNGAHTYSGYDVLIFWILIPLLHIITIFKVFGDPKSRQNGWKTVHKHHPGITCTNGVFFEKHECGVKLVSEGGREQGKTLTFSRLYRPWGPRWTQDPPQGVPKTPKLGVSNTKFR
jgi:hypothetical protein